MASVVDICNLALAHLGDTAVVTAIDPPDGSAQALHCARFYPLARNTLLEMHPWSFATRRSVLVPTDTALASPQWDYSYAAPDGVVNFLAVLPPDAIDDYSVRTYLPSGSAYQPQILPGAGNYVPQPYQVETAVIGETVAQVVLTDQADAVLRYTALVDDPTQFSPLFTVSLSWLLASMLAGPIIKGDAGAAEGKRCYQMFQAHYVEATQSDAVQRSIKPTQVVPWINGR